MARRIKERELKNPMITIIGEGATERYYFTHLKQLRGYNYVCKPRNFTEQTFDEMQKQIDRVLADNGLDTAITNANTIGMEGDTYRKLPDFVCKVVYFQNNL